MKVASLAEIKKELRELEEPALVDIALRLAKYKKENKELITYLLFEAHDEQAYIQNLLQEMDELFATLPTGNVYYIKKSLRKVLRFVNRQVRYSGIPQTELELRIGFCTRIRRARIPLSQGTVLYNLFQQQLKKINSILKKLPEDLQGDYERDVRVLQA